MQNNNFLNYLTTISDEDIRKYINSKIKYYQNTYKINKSLGVISPLKYSLPYYGFITSNIKIRYNLENDYYKIRNTNYLYEFLKYLQENKIYNNNEAILAIPLFLENYFGRKTSRLKRREDILKIESDSRIYLRDIENLKNANVATSLEYSLFAQNILTFLGYDAILLIGSFKRKSINDFYSFNIIMIDNNYYLFDFYNPVNVYDKNGEVINKQPFQVKINNSDIDLFLQGLKPLVLKEYKRIMTNHLYQQVSIDTNRTYNLNEIYE